MENEHQNFPSDEASWAVARVIEASVRVIRKAQGKRNPDEVEFGTPEWTQLADEFVCDVYRALGGDSREDEDDDAWFGVGSAG